MDGTSVTAMASPGRVSDSAWNIECIADFNGDGRTDILWRNFTTGQLNIWLMNGIVPPLEVSPGTVSDESWRIQK